MVTLALELGEGRQVFVEVEEVFEGSKRVQESSGKKLKSNFSKVSSSVSDIVNSIESQFSKLPNRPDCFEVELGVEIKGEADLWLVCGETSAHLKVTMKWEKRNE